MRSAGIALLLGLAALAAAQADAGDAPSLVGTWTLSNADSAKCRSLLPGGSRGSAEYGFGPLEISQSGEAIFVRSSGRALRYQGVAYLESDGAGSAIATSCDAATASNGDVPGTFHVSKADAEKGTLKGSFAGLWQNSGDLIVCKFSATRTSAADPMIDACPD
jgi:hypothetical protein